MLDHILFALSAGIAQISTNLDNLAVLFGLIIVMGRGRPVTGFAVAQAILLALAMGFAVGLSHTGYPAAIGYLGIVPLLLGTRGAWQQIRKREQVETRPQGAVASVIVLFLSLSFDSFAVLTPLFAESSPSYRLAGLIGAVTAAAAMSLLAAWGAPKAQRFAPQLVRFDRITPYVMIAVGLYILSNSATDML
ncbi:hypothetical protein [Ruegeria arenilitoris]|uniref:hypothetical protein n=1 Tax=Ruegeria arenilitoris TaxID=1173585 RepID=UPI001480C546|nr:hypothetical protein [Ruegeria arenilitoris]